MTDRMKQMIKWYIPNPRDPELDSCEYYYKREDEKIFKVYVCDILPHDNETHYGCRYSSNGQRVHTSYDFDGIPMRQLYDNKQDCKDESHLMYDNWEWLREEEMKDEVTGCRT